MIWNGCLWLMLEQDGDMCFWNVFFEKVVGCVRTKKPANITPHSLIDQACV